MGVSIRAGARTGVVLVAALLLSGAAPSPRAEESESRNPQGHEGPPGNGGPPCQPIPDRVPRESSRFRDPQPDSALVEAVKRMTELDPHATFSFADCEVDGFATHARPTVPPYAQRILRASGLDPRPRPVELYPDPRTDPKPVQDLDGTNLIRHRIPLPEEDPFAEKPGDEPTDEVRNDPSPGRPLLVERTEPPIVLEPRKSDFVPPSPELARRESEVVQPILLGFLRRHDDVFRMGRGQLAAGLPGLHLEGYRVGRFFRSATFSQSVAGEPVLDSRTQVLFDSNWNVINITRTLYTPRKLGVRQQRVITQPLAVAIARRAVAALTEQPMARFAPASALLGLDALRRERAWQVRMVDPRSPEFDFTVLVRAVSGQVLNISDNVDAYTDAKTRRWGYSGGDQTQPFQIISTGIYTRDDNTLRHDFFFLETDERGGGLIGQLPCTQSTSNKSLWRLFAWGTNSSSWSYIRHTHRSDRDFSLWSPAAVSGTFGESHTYFWARWFYQWMKPALNELGVLPGSAANYPKTTVLANACIDDIGYANSSLSVTIQHNEGESEGKVRLADLCRAGNAACADSDYDPANSGSFRTCEGGGCHPTPSVIHHELNHRIMGGMFGIGSGLDCGASNQLKFIHEGLLGSVLPQEFWNYWYGVGFNPANKQRLFTANAARGRVHEDVASNLQLLDYLCVNNTSGQGPYEAGRVAGQPLWEMHHGRRVVGNQILNTWRPATDTDSLILAYWAADLVASSTYRDRYEFANRVMQILEYSNWPTGAKQDYCDIFEHHELDNFIDPSYCS